MNQTWRVVGRYVSGRPLDGRLRTDSGFFRAGTRPLTPTGHASRWAMLPGWKRAAWRLGLPGTAAGTGVAYLTHPTETVVTGATLAAAAIGYTGWRAHRAWVFRQHRRTYLIPLHRTLSAALGLGLVPVGDLLDLPPDFDREGVESRIWLPQGMHLTAERKRIIRECVGAKLGLSDPDYQWRTIGPRPFVAFTPAPAPPTSVQWGAVAEAARKASDTAPVLGIGPRGVVVDADLDAESPHILISAGSGGGKSILIRTLVAQGLNRGAGAVILDYKRHSHAWARDLPGVSYCRDIAEIHDALVALGAEGERRNRASDDGSGVGPRIYIVCEEMNATISKLGAYWEQVRQKGDPKRSPAVGALADIAFMGRAVRMHLLAVAQMMTARTLGGPEVRENFATRCLTRCTQNAIKMLAPEVMPIKPPRGVGRWLIVKNGQPTVTQVAMMTDNEARKWAAAGLPNPSSVLVSPQSTQHDHQDIEVGTVPLPVADPPRIDLVTLADAVGKLPGTPITLEALKKARTRARQTGGAFPEPAGQIGRTEQYRLDDLIAWKRRRDAVRIVDGREAA